MRKILNKTKFLLVLPLVAFLLTFTSGESRAWDPVQVCERVGSRIGWHLERYEERKDDFVERVNRAIAKLKEISQKLKDRGCDTSKLEADYQNLGTQLQAWTTDYNTFINLLNEAKTLACGESEGAYKDKVRQAREQLKVVREREMGIINFYNETIKPDVEALKTACFPSED